jgi:hypothetical protein
MKTVNIRQTKNEFLKDYHSMYRNPYFRALQEAVEIVNKSIYDNFESISFSYNDDGLTYLATSNNEGDLKIIFSIKGRE